MRKVNENVITKKITETLIKTLFKNNAIFNFRRQKYMISIFK